MLRTLTAIVGAVTIIMAMIPSPAEALTPTEYEKRIAVKINQIRVIHGKPSVKYGPCADDVAERWARVIRRRDILLHQDMIHVMNKCNAEGAGEILGMGKVTPRRMIRLWMNSPSHRRVILNGRYNKIGVGAVRDADGYWWVAVDFLYQA